MRKAKVFVHRVEAGTLEEIGDQEYLFTYHTDYKGPPISLTLPISQRVYKFKKFPSFFEGLLPEGVMLEALLRKYKLDKHDYFGQLVMVGSDTVGAVTVEDVT